jgi:hypothetical protein
MSQEREMAVSSVACAVSMDQVFDGVDPQA